MVNHPTNHHPIYSACTPGSIRSLVLSCRFCVWVFAVRLASATGVTLTSLLTHGQYLVNAQFTVMPGVCRMLRTWRVGLNNGQLTAPRSSINEGCLRHRCRTSLAR